jgi:hypothetical protein
MPKNFTADACCPIPLHPTYASPVMQVTYPAKIHNMGAKFMFVTMTTEAKLAIPAQTFVLLVRHRASRIAVAANTTKILVNVFSAGL